MRKGIRQKRTKEKGVVGDKIHLALGSLFVMQTSNPPVVPQGKVSVSLYLDRNCSMGAALPTLLC